jgi:1-acyl-sn-glycerol-3-phosphate acyltransferase
MIRTLKSLIFYAYFSFATVIYGLLCLIIFPIIKQKTRYQLIKFFCHGFVLACKYICGISYRIKGLEHLNQAAKKHPESLFIVSNHQSTWETLAFFAILPVRLCFVLKKELIFIPIFGWVLGMLDMLHIDRKQGHRAFIFLSQNLVKRLKKQYVPLMFPEGTRTQVGETMSYKPGASKLIYKQKLNVILIAHNAGRFYPKSSYLKTPGCIEIEIMPVLSSKDFANSEILNQKMQNLIEEHCKKNQNIN